MGLATGKLWGSKTICANHETWREALVDPLALFRHYPGETWIPSTAVKLSFSDMLRIRVSRGGEETRTRVGPRGKVVTCSACPDLVGLNRLVDIRSSRRLLGTSWRCLTA